MSLQPEHNSAYWPLLLTEDLYLLPEELQQLALQQQAEAVAPAPAPAVSPALPLAEDAAIGGAKAATPQPDLLWGSLDRGILILVAYPGHKLMDRPDGLFLVEVLKALKLDFKEVATVNVSRCQSPADWHYLRELPWKQLISFGVQVQELPFTEQTQAYVPRQWENRLVLPAEDLGMIRQDLGRKKQLWNLLRQGMVL